MLSCGPTECEAPGEMSGGQQNADLRGRREAHVQRCGGHISSEMASKDAGAKSRPLSNTTCRKRGCCACDLDGAASIRGWSVQGDSGVVSGSQGEKVCQEEEVVGSLGSRPQTMWDVELKASTRFSNKKVRGGLLLFLYLGPGGAEARLREVGGEEVRNACADTPG